MDLLVKQLIILLWFGHLTHGYWFDQTKMKCISSRVGRVISQCQAEVKSSLIEDLLAPFNGHSFEPLRHNVHNDDSLDQIHHGLNENVYFPSRQPIHIIPTEYFASPHHHHARNLHDHPPFNYQEVTPSNVVFEQSPSFHPFQSFGSQPVLQVPFAIHSNHDIYEPYHHHALSHQEHYHHEPHHRLQKHYHPLSKPINVVEGHETLSTVLAVNMGRNIHENHHEISSVLEKLRNEKLGETPNINVHEKRVKRSLFDRLKQPKESLESTTLKLRNEDRWLAGCLLQCVFKKTDALDQFGNPTLDGITKIFTDGTTKQTYFLHVLRTVDRCLKISSDKYRGIVLRESCLPAFDLFDCITDSVTEYCS